MLPKFFTLTETLFKVLLLWEKSATQNNSIAEKVEKPHRQNL